MFYKYPAANEVLISAILFQLFRISFVKNGSVSIWSCCISVPRSHFTITSSSKSLNIFFFPCFSLQRCECRIFYLLWLYSGRGSVCLFSKHTFCPCYFFFFFFRICHSVTFLSSHWIKIPEKIFRYWKKLLALEPNHTK